MVVTMYVRRITLQTKRNATYGEEATVYEFSMFIASTGFGGIAMYVPTYVQV